MLSYQDKTYCMYWQDCMSGKDCHRALTDEVQKDAEMWWGSDTAPITVYRDEPWCFEEKHNVSREEGTT